MAVQLTLLDGELAFGSHPLLDRAALTINDGERIGLIGRNGTGKSSLLKVLAGQTPLDDGRLVRRDALKVVYVEQEPVLPTEGLASDTVADALARRADVETLMAHDEREGWQLVARIAAWLERFGVDGGLDPVRLSGGQSKRAALALAFAQKPDLLLLDEPTNHLDIGAIESLEEWVRSGPTCVVITHDRRFLDQVATRIVELDRGMLRSFPGSFSSYEKLRGEQLAAEETERRKFDKFWAQEEVWIRKGVEARRTRNEGRVRRLEALRVQRAERRDRVGSLKLQVDSGERSGKLVCELEGVSQSFGDRVLVRGLDLTLMRGDRLGLIGPNGAGKSTLLRLMLGQLEPDEGRIRLGTNLNIAYFDQLRTQLLGDSDGGGSDDAGQGQAPAGAWNDPAMQERTVAELISPGSDYVEINGQRRHIMSYLSDFLFSARQAQSPLRTLSGGERNRLLLARLFARPANLLVLDEPTNDLDLESIDLLEDLLQSYAGTLLLVSHDRSFLDNIVTTVLVSRPEGRWLELVGGYSDWEEYRRQMPADEPSGTGADGSGAAPVHAVPVQTLAPGAAPTPSPKPAPTPAPTHSPKPAPKPVRLSYKEQRELEQLPGQIDALEKTHEELNAAMASPAFYRQLPEQIKAHQTRIEETDAKLLAAMERWEQLVSRQEGSDGGGR